MFLSNDPKTDCCIGCWFSPGCVLQFQIFQGPNTVIHTGAMISTVTELFGQYLRQISKQMCLLLQQNSSGMTVGIYCTAYWEVRLWIKTGLFSRTSLLLVLFPGFVDRKRKNI